MEWFAECADEFFVAQGEMGESLEVAEAMQQEVDHFEHNTQVRHFLCPCVFTLCLFPCAQQILARAKHVLKSGSDLKNRDSEVRARFEKIDNLIVKFDERLNQLKRQLAESVRLHKLIQEVCQLLSHAADMPDRPCCVCVCVCVYVCVQAFDWCVRGMEICSDYDILTAHPDTFEPSEVRQRYAEFLSQDDTFTAAQLQELTELADKASSPFTKDNAIFASNRVMEMSERFKYYQSILDSMAEEKRQRVEQEANNKQQLMQQVLGLAEAMDVLVGVAVGIPSDVQQSSLVQEPLPLPHSSSVQVSNAYLKMTHDHLNINGHLTLTFMVHMILTFMVT